MTTRISSRSSLNKRKFWNQNDYNQDLTIEEHQFLGDLRSIILTKTPINQDWDWRKVEDELRLISNLFKIKCEMIRPIQKEFKDSRLLDYEPDRSKDSLRLLPSFEALDSITIKSCPKTYDRSIIRSAEFFFNGPEDHHHHPSSPSHSHSKDDNDNDNDYYYFGDGDGGLKEIGQRDSGKGKIKEISRKKFKIDSHSIWLLDFNSGLPNILFRYIHELSKIYEYRRFINFFSCDQISFKLLINWNRSFKVKKLNNPDIDPFDSEKDLIIRTKDLLEREIKRESFF